MTAYLVIREGSKWTDVFRLVEGESVTVGRAPTNAIVVKDERCSRNHAEVFQSQGNWTLRDLDSRNGTLVDGQRIQTDYHLQAGEIIRIGNSHLAFVNDLSQAFPDSHSVLRTAQAVDSEVSGEMTVGPPDHESVLETYEPTTITHRRGQSRFLEPPEEEDVDVSLPKVGRAAANLCRLAFGLAKATDVVSLANTALDGLFEGTQVDAGAVLLQARRPNAKTKADNLEVIASRSDSPHRYHRVSQFLSTTVMRDGQAVLARNVMDDSQLGSRDSKGEILATSVICAPIRRDGKVLGVIHLYSTDVAKSTDPDDLEFTLAVADTVAVALENLSKQQELAENLNQIRDENLQLRERLGVQSEIVGGSEPMNQVTRDIARAARAAPRFSSAAKAASAKNWSPAPSTSPARAAKARSSASIAPPFPRRFSKANCSVTKRVRSPAPPSARSASSKPRTKARSCSTKSAR